MCQGSEHGTVVWDRRVRGVIVGERVLLLLLLRFLLLLHPSPPSHPPPADRRPPKEGEGARGPDAGPPGLAGKQAGGLADAGVACFACKRYDVAPQDLREHAGAGARAGGSQRVRR